MADFVQHFINGIAAGTIYALVALGYTMVYGVLKLINFAHGDVMMVGAYVGYGTAVRMGPASRGSFLGATLVFLLSMASCAALGFAIERLAYRPLREKPRLTALITAIGISFTLEYGFQLNFLFLPGAAPRAFPEIIIPTEWLVIGDRDVVLWNWQVLSLAIAVALMVLLQYLVFRTRFGRAMRAVSFDHRIAALMGIPTDRIYAIKDTVVQPLMGLYVGLKAFVAAVIGGIGHVPGAMVGGLLLGLVEEFVVGYTSSSWRDAVAFGFLILILLLRPEGLFGRVTAEKV